MKKQKNKKQLKELRNKIIEQIEFLEKSKKNNVDLSTTSHIFAWKGFLSRVDKLRKPDKKIKLPTIKVGDYFCANKSMIVYKAKSVNNGMIYGTNKLAKMGISANIKVHVANITLVTKEDYRKQHETDKNNKAKIKRKKSKK